MPNDRQDAPAFGDDDLRPRSSGHAASIYGTRLFTVTQSLDDLERASAAVSASGANPVALLPEPSFAAAGPLARVAHLVDKHDFELMTWCDRYGKGVWAVCMPAPLQAQAINNASEAGDDEAMWSTEYILECVWMPAVTADGLVGALAKLEERLSSIEPGQLHRRSDWTRATCAAMVHFDDMRRARAWHSLRALPSDFAIVAAAAARQLREGGDVLW